MASLWCEVEHGRQEYSGLCIVMALDSWLKVDVGTVVTKPRIHVVLFFWGLYIVMVIDFSWMP